MSNKDVHVNKYVCIYLRQRYGGPQKHVRVRIEGHSSKYTLIYMYACDAHDAKVMHSIVTII